MLNYAIILFIILVIVFILFNNFPKKYEEKILPCGKKLNELTDEEYIEYFLPYIIQRWEEREKPRGMSLEDLKDICMQYGEDYSSNSKDELIRTIMEVELSHQELEDYEKYLKYYYFSVFREQMTGLSELDGYISQIEELYIIKVKTKILGKNTQGLFSK